MHLPACPAPTAKTSSAFTHELVPLHLRRHHGKAADRRGANSCRVHCGVVGFEDVKVMPVSRIYEVASNDERLCSCLLLPWRRRHKVPRSCRQCWRRRHKLVLDFSDLNSNPSSMLLSQPTPKPTTSLQYSLQPLPEFRALCNLTFISSAVRTDPIRPFASEPLQTTVNA